MTIQRSDSGLSLPSQRTERSGRGPKHPSLFLNGALPHVQGFIVESRPVTCRTASLAAARVAWPRALDANADSPPPTPKSDIPLVAVSAVNLPAATPPPRIRPVWGSTI